MLSTEFNFKTKDIIMYRQILIVSRGTKIYELKPLTYLFSLDAKIN